MEKLIKDNWTAIRKLAVYWSWKFNMDVDDVHSGILERVVLRFHTYKPQESATFKTWVSTVARSYCIDAYRMMYKKDKNNIDIDAAIGVGVIDSCEMDLEVINEKISALGNRYNEKQMAIFRLRAQGYKFREIGIMFGMKELATRSIHFRMKRDLQTQLQKINVL